MGVIPPGENPKKPGKPNTVRLYSIASSRYGDDMTGTTTSLCVRRATYWCPELKADDPPRRASAPTSLRLQAGDELALTGPSGKVMLIWSDVDLIMVATNRHRAVPQLHPPPLRREDPVRRGVQGPAWLSSPTPTPCSTTTSGRRSSVPTTSASTTRSRASRRTWTAARCTSGQVKEYADEVFEHGQRRTCTSAASRA